jgi:hypothetical protein
MYSYAAMETSSKETTLNQDLTKVLQEAIIPKNSLESVYTNND